MTVDDTSPAGIESVAPAPDLTSTPEQDAAADAPATTDPVEVADADLGPEGGEPQPAEDIEVEHEGQRYKVPKALKEAFLRQQDYTQKTMAVAETRREQEARAQSLEQHAKLLGELHEVAADVTSYDKAIKQFETIDWAAWRAQNSKAAEDGRWRYDQLKDARAKAFGQLQTKAAERSQMVQRDSAKRQEDTLKFAKDHVPGWTPDLDVKITEFARSNGLSDQFIQSNLSPATYKLMHLAYLGHEMTQKATAAKAKSPSGNGTVQQPPPVQPLKAVGARSAGTGKRPLTDPTLPMDQYVARRRAGEKG